MARSLLVLSGGHPYEEVPFSELLDSLKGWDVRYLIHPEAEIAVAEGAADAADAILLYDMPGYAFADGKVTSRPPSDGFKAAIRRYFESDKGAVMMHHALAGWADWPDWAEMIGGRFLYQPGEVRGREVRDSGYRHDVRYTAEICGDHPVTHGLPDTFELTDELYLAEIFEDDVEPLIRARHDFVAENFYSAAHAVAGRMFDNTGWDHPPGSNLVAWTKSIGDARLVYLQFGDGPETYRNPHVRQLLRNALDHVANGRSEPRETKEPTG
ncbi:ThuA domain-containing protein [Parasphingopyxis algicola]|uniref:ThuA domain-containing protein n=1 Tax=Parasphingopyxis algicola TaxID=2026624 RepID=UPI0015A4C430|nr:ThuA domain-containing protein [Parasphingopyxis algicola]QLC25404.1 ThuA domain-containing protein [Parasphingopyxis algicola]